MPAFLTFLDTLRTALSQGLFAVGVALTLVCGIDWLVRTRRLNPFGQVARFFRQTVEPLMAPVERQIVRAGGVPTNAPWWSLVAVVVIGIVVLSIFDFARDQLIGIYSASQSGSRGILRLVISWSFAVLQIAIMVRVVCSWIRVSPYSRWVRWAFTLSEPILRPLRQLIPTLGMIDVTPIVAYLLLSVLQRLVLGLT